MSSERPTVRGNGTALCVFCRRHSVAAAWRPFCSERCKVQDLARWAEGAYHVPSDPIAEAGAEAPDGSPGTS